MPALVAGGIAQAGQGWGQPIRISMEQWEASIGYTYKF
jgi:hypothetical protein